MEEKEKTKNANHRDLFHPTQEYWSTFEYISSRAMTGGNNHDFFPVCLLLFIRYSLSFVHYTPEIALRCAVNI